MSEPKYRRVVVKLSGEFLAGDQPFGIHQPTIDRIARDLMDARELGVELAVVVGGGNIFRGVDVSSRSAMRSISDGAGGAVRAGVVEVAARISARVVVESADGPEVSARGVSRPRGDTMGMLATVMNCIALESSLERQGQSTRVLSSFVMPQVCELFTRRAAFEYLAQGRIVLLAGGTGNPFFTTDTTAVLRGAEIGADAVLKATNVDGVYSADPKKHPDAIRFERLTHSQALDGGYKVMDATAFALARDTAMPIIVFSVAEEGSLGAILKGEDRGTIVAG